MCECCKRPAPFTTPDDHPFLEVHHLTRLTDGGPDRIDAVAAICPNCHRELHFGKQRETMSTSLIGAIGAKEQR
jgi:5-methylcytosine-specific restriction protein A